MRNEIEAVINLFNENIEIDKQFDQKLIKEEALEEFYQNLEKFISYINGEIDKLTEKNDKQISNKFDKINSEAELSGEAIKYLAQKYKK